MAHSLERFYPQLPVWAQNAGISLFGLAWKRERLGGRFDEFVAGFRERDRWTPAQLDRYIQTELRRVLLRAFRHVPYYREKWTAAGWTESDFSSLAPGDLASLPITRKNDLRAQPDDFVADDLARSGRLHRYSSSGSTGTPVTAICTPEDHQRFIAAREVRSFGWAGTSVRAPRSMIGGRLVVPEGDAPPPFHRYNWAERQVYFSAFHISPKNVPHYVRALNHHRPEVFTGYAHSHYLLARMMNARGLSLDYQPKAAVLSSEKLTSEMKAVIRQALRVRAFDEYGTVENCALATECEEGRLHVSPDFGLLEIVDADGQPVPPGKEGRIVCTGLLNFTQPLVRYEIGDLGVWASDPCPCGRAHLPVLQEIVGRIEDVIVGPDGRELVRFHWVFLDLPGVIEGQIVQEAIDRFTVRLVTRDSYSDSTGVEIKRRFHERLGRVQVRIERVPEIPRTNRGKFRAVISMLGSGKPAPAAEQLA